MKVSPLFAACVMVTACGGSSAEDPTALDSPSAPALAPATSAMPYINNALMPEKTTVSYSTERVRATSEIAESSVDGVGAFRTVCTYSHMAYDDPIVLPGQPGRSHLHTFFGNTGTDAFSTVSSIANTGNSTCRGGTINRSSYWVPSLIDTTNGAPIVPELAHVYYKSAYGGVRPSSIQPMPNGLRFIAGDARAVASNGLAPFRWHCERNGTHHSDSAGIPNCPAGEILVVELSFPQCWDGRNLDSPDHKSHMAYANNGCPTSHPIALSEVSLIVHWKVPAGKTGTQLRLSSDAYPTSTPGGYSMHGDWFMGWSVSHRDAWTDNCVRAVRDCGSHLLGDGRATY
jgi:Domain of unknown function (DUF1996)